MNKEELILLNQAHDDWREKIKGAMNSLCAEADAQGEIKILAAAMLQEAVYVLGKKHSWIAVERLLHSALVALKFIKMIEDKDAPKTP